MVTPAWRLKRKRSPTTRGGGGQSAHRHRPGRRSASTSALLPTASWTSGVPASEGRSRHRGRRRAAPSRRRPPRRRPRPVAALGDHGGHRLAGEPDLVVGEGRIVRGEVASHPRLGADGPHLASQLVARSRRRSHRQARAPVSRRSDAGARARVGFARRRRGACPVAQDRPRSGPDQPEGGRPRPAAPAPRRASRSIRLRRSCGGRGQSRAHRSRIRSVILPGRPMSSHHRGLHAARSCDRQIAGDRPRARW